MISTKSVSLAAATILALFLVSVGAADKPTPTSPAENSPASVSPVKNDPKAVQPTLHVLLYDATKNWLFDLNFQADPATGDDFRNKPGVWLRATGQGLNGAGKVIATEMNVALRIRARELPKTSFPVGKNSTLFALEDRAVDFFSITYDAKAASRHASVVSFAGKRVAEFELSPEWDALLLEQSETAGVLAEVYRLLTEEGDRGATNCSPTWGECYTMAAEACHETGIKSFHYECNPETGAVVCEFECFPPAGGDGTPP